MRGIRAILKPALSGLLACVALPASAGTLYRCVGETGIPAIVDAHHRPNRAKCEIAANFAASGAHAEAITSTAPAYVPTPVATVPVGHDEPLAPVRPPPQRIGTQRHYYSYIQNGVRTYDDFAPKGQFGSLRVRTYAMDRCYACGKSSVDFASVPLNTNAYSSEIASASHEFGVDEAVVRAIIHAESAFRWNAKSKVGAQGLMQLMPDTARRFGVQDAFDAAQNIRGGVQYLAWLLKRYGGDLGKTAAGYNAGEGAVDRHGGVPPYSETRLYVTRVNQLYARYSKVLAAR